MLKTLEIAWLCFTVISIIIAIFQYFREGWEAGLWMLFITMICMVMYTVRRRQRLKYERKDEKELYH